jgi:hypothetical protein
MIADVAHEFRRYRAQCEKALASVTDAQFLERPGTLVNPLALIVKHVAGNLQSRWSDFLTTDGDKPSRNRDQEFILAPSDTRPALMAAWQQGWETLLNTLAPSPRPTSRAPSPSAASRTPFPRRCSVR